VHKVLSSYDIMGGPATFNVLYTTQKFHDENPKTYRAFYKALVEAAEFVRNNKAKAADTFIRVQKSKLAPEFVRRIVEDPEINFTVSPERTFVYAEQLHALGVLKNAPTAGRTTSSRKRMHNPAAETASVSAAASLQPLLQVDRVSLQYRTATAVVQATHEVSFDVHPADRFVLLGPSGCGKSTCSRRWRASCRRPGRDPPRGPGASAGAGPHRGVPEFDQLPPWKTVLQNVMFPLLASRTLGKREAAERARTTWTRSAWRALPMPIRTRCPAA
jgi:hypothetical protein